jgi:hypothetical protein
MVSLETSKFSSQSPEGMFSSFAINDRDIDIKKAEKAIDGVFLTFSLAPGRP